MENSGPSMIHLSNCFHGSHHIFLLLFLASNLVHCLFFLILSMSFLFLHMLELFTFSSRFFNGSWWSDGELQWKDGEGNLVTWDIQTYQTTGWRPPPNL